jgi:serine/threonine-protein kinase SRPK3
MFGNSLYYSDKDLQQYLDANPAEIEGQAQLEPGGESYLTLKFQPIPNGYVYDTSAFEAELIFI